MIVLIVWMVERMKTDHEIMQLILEFAKSRDDVRVVYMNGSRVNPTIKKDCYQDFDVVFGVTTTYNFLQNREWINQFGDVCMIQEPDLIDCTTGIKLDTNFNQSYTWLILYQDGNRIDLHIELLEDSKHNIHHSSLTTILLDKDNCLDSLDPSNDSDYHIKKPTQAIFSACNNEFWWCLNNVAKGLARNEVPYAMTMLNVYCRDMLNKMVDWHIGLHHDFKVSSGKLGKFYKDYLSSDDYSSYLKTYSDGDLYHIWTSLFNMCTLYRKLAYEVSTELQFVYNIQDDENMTNYLKMVYQRKTSV